MNTFAGKTALALLCSLSLAVGVRAQTTPASASFPDGLGGVNTSPKDTVTTPSTFGPPPFKAKAEPRTMNTGPEVAIFGGITFMQGGDFKENYALGASRSSWWATTREHTGEVFGAKAGYTWPGLGKGAGFTSSDVSREIDEDTKFQLLPSVEFEFFYDNHTYEGKGPLFSTGAGARAVNETDFKADMTNYVFTVNPVMRAQVWRFRPYVGAGVGGAISQLKNAKVASAYPETGAWGPLGNQPDDQYTLCPAAQIEVGTDFFITKTISLFAEYKFLALFNPVFKGPGSYNYEGDYTGESLATVGVRYHF